MENLYIIFDKRLGACVYVFTAVSDDCAVRMFDCIVIQPGSNIANSPEDFDLYSLGVIDMSTCSISTFDRKFICSAFDRQLLMQALHERRRMKLNSLVGSLPSSELGSAAAVPSGSGSDAAPSGSGSDAAPSGSGSDAAPSGSGSDAAPSGSDVVVHESRADRVASVFGLAASSESEVK